MINSMEKVVYKTLQLFSFFWIATLSVATNLGAGIRLAEPNQNDITQDPLPAKALQPPDIVSNQKPPPPFIRFTDPYPEVIQHGSKVKFECLCTDGLRFGFQLKVQNLQQKSIIVFNRKWPCRFKGFEEMTVTLKLPDIYAYRPSFLNVRSEGVLSSELYLWTLQENAITSTGLLDNYRKATVRASRSVKLLEPLSRRGKPTGGCVSWGVIVMMSRPYTPHCTKQPEVFHAVPFPVALSGGRGQGVSRMLPEYSETVLRREREDALYNPRLTISVRLYMISACSIPLCSIVQRMTWDEKYCTPLVYINPQGRIHLQTVLSDGSSSAFITDFSIPLLQWCHLVVTAEGRKWAASLSCEQSSDQTVHPQRISHFSFAQDVYYDDTACLTMFGGTEIANSFKGYIGDAVIYRRKALSAEQLPPVSRYHPMYELGLADWGRRCHKYLAWAGYVQQRARAMIEHRIHKVTCPDEVRAWFFPTQPLSHDVCDIASTPVPRHYSLVYHLVRRAMLQGRDVLSKDIAAGIMANVTASLEDSGLLGISDVMSLLRQASCYGNHDASFMLATILNNGMGVKVDENQAHRYLMLGAVESSVLSLLALGNKHALGLDRRLHDNELAYAYYKVVAEQTKEDKELHHKDGVLTEHVWLTDDEALDAQTDEKGDVFMWLKHQSQQGVVSAQREIARMLYWGSQGIARNTDAAVDYYRMGAEAEDPIAQYDYGIVLLKGHGVEKNETLALSLFERSAEQGNALAYGVLGWYAMEVEHDLVKAVEYLEKAYSLGDTDAAHNLGYLMWSGRYPGVTGRQRVGALPYYSYAAMHSQIDSGVMIGLYNIRGGEPMKRDAPNAVEWVRYIGEKNIAIGKILRRGLKAYRNHNWSAALLYYHMAAETGLEVGTFNTAYLCEANQDGLVSYLQKDCVWRFYNQSTQRDTNKAHPYAWIKMGDYHWLGCAGQQNAAQAAHFYGAAAKGDDPHGLFNLGLMLEDGAVIPTHILKDVNLHHHGNHTTQVLLDLYNRCSESAQTEAYMPCTLSYYRIKVTDLWQQYFVLVKLSSAVGAMVTVIITISWIQNIFRQRQQLISNV